MTVLRNILNDLIEKKLWPIAIALVVALVALPLALGGGGSDEPVAPPAAPATAAPVAGVAKAGGVAVALEGDAAVDKRVRKGAVRNPFKQLAKAQSTDTAAGTGMSTGTGASTGTSAGTTGATPSTGAPATSTPSVPTPSGQTSPVKVDPELSEIAKDGDITSKEVIDTFAREARFETVLRFGERGGKLRRHENPRLLRAFPSSSLPLVVISHVRDDKKAVRFVVNALARVASGGKCYPSRAACRTLDLREGSSAIVEVAASPTEVAAYRLEVARIGKPD